MSSVRAALAIRSKENCHPFERLRLSGRSRKIVIRSNDSGYLLEKIVILSNGSGYPFEKIVIRLNGSTSYPLKTIVSPATVLNHFFYLAPCKGIHDSRGFWIPPCGFRIPSTGFRIPAQWIPDSKKGWIPNFFLF